MIDETNWDMAMKLKYGLPFICLRFHGWVPLNFALIELSVKYSKKSTKTLCLLKIGNKEVGVGRTW
jgi:hypothetical protein